LGWIAFSMVVQGAWLEGRPYARRLEWGRLIATLAFAGAVYAMWPGSLQDIAIALASYAALSGATVAIGSSRPAENLSPSRQDAKI
jgi:hypothetical protein